MQFIDYGRTNRADGPPLLNGTAAGAAIHDVLRVCDVIHDDSNSRGKSDLKRIVSMLTRLIQRTAGVSEGSIEYEYRDAEYEYDSDRIAQS